MDSEQALQQYFNIASFRHNQGDIVQSILDGDDTLVIMPTGGGKSLCYQLPAMMLDGVTVVVSPLISLMKDQVDSLEKLGIPATYINSSLGVEEMNERITGIYHGKYKLVYVAPERFKSGRFVELMREVGVSFFAIDEAHCISQWGHDFRPDYMRLGEVIRGLGRPRVGAFTATATPEVQADIIANIGLESPRKFISGFKRPNLELRVVHAARDTEKYSHLGRLIDEQKTGIIYCATRKRVEKVADILRTWDCSFVAYHAGLSDEERQEAQERFMGGHVDIAVATNAFGMGIDRSDIRFVAHIEMPGSIEAYYQEVGRAGRDGGHSVCELYYGYADKRIQEFFIEGSNPSKSFIESVFLQLLREADLHNEVKMSIEDLGERIGKGTNSMAVSTSLSHLVRARVVDRFDIPGKRIKGTRLLDPDLSPRDLPLDFDLIMAKEDRDRHKLDSVIKFCNSIGCRQEWILRHFGEVESEACGVCDQCKMDGGAERRELSEEEMVIVQKALSGVARMSWRNGDGSWKARFGKGKIVQMLVGSKSQWLEDTGMNKLSTYGILSDVSRGLLDDIFRDFERLGLVEIDTENSKFPKLALTMEGTEVMMGRRAIKLNWPEGRASVKLHKEKKPEVVTDGVDLELYELLRQKRVEVARAMRNARLFMVLSNKTLEHLASKKPRTLEEASEIPGIGPAKIKRIVPRFLDVINAYMESKDQEEMELSA